jgi:hypothetical protein
MMAQSGGSGGQGAAAASAGGAAGCGPAAEERAETADPRRLHAAAQILEEAGRAPVLRGCRVLVEELALDDAGEDFVVEEHVGDLGVLVSMGGCWHIYRDLSI